MIDAWSGKRIAIVVDAIAGEGPHGTVRCFDATNSKLPSSFAGR